MQRHLVPIEGNTQRLDGGAMFGNAPRALWTRWLTPDQHNRVPLACRALLVEEEDRLVLLETGIGAFFDPDRRRRFGVEEDRHVLLDSLAARGIGHEDVDVVVLSHLHFDHAGGLLTSWREDTPPELLFPRARFVVGRRAWERALAPHPRDRASFIPELPGLLEATRRLELVDGERSEVLGRGYRLHQSDGHTPGMLLTEIETDDGPVVFVADLVPGRPWTHVPITMGYDRCAELVVDEKRALLEGLVDRRARLFFTHDHEVALARLTRDERGRFASVPTGE
jgi:glyoxylase-like metal-dependent hydrolase (beta-lactamase superfamily II)